MEFMLAEDPVKDAPDETKVAWLRRVEARGDRIAEKKLDGTRASVGKKADGFPTIPNRRGLDYAKQRNLPEIVKIAEKFQPDTITDGEIVAYAEDGSVNRILSQKRCSTTNPAKVAVLKQHVPVDFIAWDILRLNGEDLEDLALIERKKILKRFVDEIDDEHFKYLPHISSGFAELFMAESEGLMVKLKNGRYLHKRVNYWQKVKHTIDRICDVDGYTIGGTGWRADYWRSLVLTVDGKYVGKAGGGATEQQIKDIWKLFHQFPQEQAFRIGSKKLSYIKVKTGLKVEVTYCEETEYGIMFQPRIKRVFYPSIMDKINAQMPTVRDLKDAGLGAWIKTS